MRRIAMPQHRIPILVAAFCSVLWALPAAAIDPPAVAARVEPSMVRIIVESESRIAGASGFVVSAEGHIATNYHVVQPHLEAGWDIYVLASGDGPEERRSATVVASYPEEDLAVLRVEGLDRPPVVLSEAELGTLTQGTTVFAIGFPGAGGRLSTETGTSFTAGMANRLFQGAWTHDGARIHIIQHSAATNPGSSGGPIVNACGQVVGVNTEREMAVVIMPPGIPIVYDVIQGVFFASHVSVLTGKLSELGIAYDGSSKVCRVLFGIASTDFEWYAAAALAGLLVLVALIVRFWPRPVIHVVVLGGRAARSGALAVGHVLKPPWRRRRRGASWRLRIEGARDGQGEIVITEDDLRHAPEGLVIGRDAECDRRLPVDGVEGRHAKLVPLGEGLGVADLHTTGGTAVDEQPIDPDRGPAPLADGARLRLGRATLRVERR